MCAAAYLCVGLTHRPLRDSYGVVWTCPVFHKPKVLWGKERGVSTFNCQVSALTKLGFLL